MACTPVTLQFLTLIFLLTTIIVAARRGVPAWMLKVLPVLRVGLGNEEDPLLRETTMLYEMKELGKKLSVTLKHKGDDRSVLLVSKADEENGYGHVWISRLVCTGKLIYELTRYRDKQQRYYATLQLDAMPRLLHLVSRFPRHPLSPYHFYTQAKS